MSLNGQLSAGICSPVKKQLIWKVPTLNEKMFSSCNRAACSSLLNWDPTEVTNRNLRAQHKPALCPDKAGLTNGNSFDSSPLDTLHCCITEFLCPKVQIFHTTTTRHYLEPPKCEGSPEMLKVSEMERGRWRREMCRNPVRSFRWVWIHSFYLTRFLSLKLTDRVTL